MARSTLGDRNIAYGTVRLEGALGFLAYHWLFGVLHELVHLAILLGVGLKLKHVLTRDNAVGALWKRRVQVSASMWNAPLTHQLGVVAEEVRHVVRGDSGGRSRDRRATRAARALPRLEC